MSILLDEYYEKLASARTALFDEYHAIEHKEHAPEGKWSAQQVLTHLYLSENSIARIFRSAERVGQHRTPYTNEELAEERRLTTFHTLDRSILITAPERISPVQTMEDAEVQLGASRQMLLEYSAQLSDEQLRGILFHHPVRGDLSLYGWLWFVAHHEMRHTEQIKELRL